MHQEIQYCTASDGVRLAYSKIGKGTPVVRTPHWFAHLEHDLKGPIYRHQILGLAHRHTLLRYDGRGIGLSQRNSVRTAPSSITGGSITFNVSPPRPKWQNRSSARTPASMSSTCCRRCACQPWSCIPVATSACHSVRDRRLLPAFLARNSSRWKAGTTSSLPTSRLIANSSMPSPRFWAIGAYEHTTGYRDLEGTSAEQRSVAAI